jgi:hypothetical protein
MIAARLFARAWLENGEVIRPRLSQILRATKCDKLSDTRKCLRCRARYSRVWNWERKVWRTGDAIATSFFGSLRSAWRKQVPTRTCNSLIV